MADVFEKFNKMSIEEYGLNSLLSLSLPGYTWQCRKEFTDIIIQTLQDKQMILLIENKKRGDVSSVMSNRYVISDENKKILYIDANNLYGWDMSEYLPYEEIKFD